MTDDEQVDAGEEDFIVTHGGRAEWVAMAIQTASGGRMDRSAIGEHPCTGDGFTKLT